MQKRLSIPNYTAGMPIAAGQYVRYTYERGGNSHAYLLRALCPFTLGATPDFGCFEILNPTTFAATMANADSSNISLAPGDKLVLVDTGEVLHNTANNTTKTYKSLKGGTLHRGKAASLFFKNGRNETQTYKLSAAFQQQKPEGGGSTSVFRKTFSLSVLNAPLNFEGFVKVENMSDFNSIRTAYPTQGIGSVPVLMAYPVGLSVTATYDQGSQYNNAPNLGDFFYLKFERSGGTLNVTRYPNNTTPIGA